MNVFVLCTGRCGSVTFARACAHLSNYTSGHESRVRELGPARVAYPDRHIEVDNRLAWFLGWLEERYGGDAFYVHLLRDEEATAQSFNGRWHLRGSIVRAHAEQVRMMSPKDPMAMCKDFVASVNANIRTFLRDKPRTLTVRMEEARKDFPEFLTRIGAEGDLDAAVAEWDTAHNRTR